MTMIYPTSLDRLVDVASYCPEILDEETARDLALLLDLEGILDGLDEHDGNRVVGALCVNLATGTGPEGLRRQADGAWDDAHDHPAVCAAILRLAALFEALVDD